MRRTVDQRFDAKVDKGSSPHGCWLWTGAMNEKGYGQFSVNGRNTPAHRFALERAIGALSGGLKACHNCPERDNPACVNPAHLWPGTHQQNINDYHSKRMGKLATDPTDADPFFLFPPHTCILCGVTSWRVLSWQEPFFVRAGRRDMCIDVDDCRARIRGLPTTAYLQALELTTLEVA